MKKLSFEDLKAKAIDVLSIKEMDKITGGSGGVEIKFEVITKADA